MKHKSLGVICFLLLTACLAPTPRPALVSASAGLTPSSKGERLTPTSKGERGIVSGRLLRADNTPVADALIRIEGTASQVRADAQGRFEIKDVPVGGDFFLLAESLDENGQSLKARVGKRIPTGQSSLNLESLLLTPTGSVTGLVSLSDGSSPLGADVFVAGSSLVAKADSQGSFALTNMPEGNYRLTAQKSGYGTAVSAEFTIRAGQISRLPSLSLSPEAEPSGSASLSGRISSEGEPVAGAQVALVGDELTRSQLTLTDSQGRYLFGRVAPRTQPYTLIVSRPFYTTAEAEVNIPAGPASKDLELESETLTLGRLQVSVNNCAGQPVASALIQLDPTPSLNPVAFTDNRGLSRLNNLLPGPYTVYAAKGEQLTFTGITIDNRRSGSDNQPGALAKVSLVLGSPCAESENP